MQTKLLAAVIATTAIAGNQSHAQSADEILEAAWEAQVSRWEGLDSYLVEQTIMDRPSEQYFVRTTVADSAGNSRTMFLPASDAGGDQGCFKSHSTSQSPAGSGDASAEYMTWFLESAELVGEEAIDGTASWQLRADDVDHSQTTGQEEVKIDSMTMWLSKDDYLPLKFRMEGTSTAEGQSRAVTIESLASDFRAVPDSKLKEPFHRTVTIGGMMSDVDDEQVAEAKKAMAEFEQQLASMPASQRKMMESMMGPQIEQMRRLAESGSIETEVVVESITANPEVNGKRVVACDAG